ncbi:MAG: hypothetical protein JXB48_05745 [Candidatus Latescibacteria bacterium]|nr:hypothetical protein [Candidatus Latescibacterota bacterium]
MEDLSISYCFTMEDGKQHIFDLLIGGETLDLKKNISGKMPSWINLEFHQCSNCTLSTATHMYCPLSLSLVDIVQCFNKFMSYEDVQLDVITKERKISQKTTIQRGISSLMGLVMATSGCPYTKFFKPMARFHLVMANEEETLYRAASMYMLAQYYLNQEGRVADIELNGLKKIYNDIQVVNAAVTQRLRTAAEADSSINAIILLDTYAQAIPFIIEKSINVIRYLFLPYLSGENRTKDNMNI